MNEKIRSIPLRTQVNGWLARALSLISLLACTALIAACASVTPAGGIHESLGDTTWTGVDSDGDAYEFMFQASGALHYKSPTGYWKNGRWKRDGQAIYFEMNEKFSEYNGLIEGDTMSGQAWNTQGHRWKWVVQRKRRGS